ncbi:MAG: amidase [Woeseiaceae bacterium]|nr:amidase [Woeseiaceae bacterium]
MRNLLLALLLCLGGCAESLPDVTELTIADIQAGFDSGELTAEQLVRVYADRIERIDRSGPSLNSIIEINPDALGAARTLDTERRESGARGPLHGIPVLLKANIDTGDRMRTSAGSLALAEHVPPDDAALVARLREAGAVILGKANLSEWANFRSEYSSSGWSSVGGQTHNAYDPTRNPCGSSSGSAVAVAANLAMLAVGTETNGSVVCPSGINGIVGIKPTLGVVSQDGIIPIAHSQDTAGPMARTVRDAALLLEALAGADFTSGLDSSELHGRRIGIIRNYYGAGHPGVDLIYDAAIDVLRQAGAEVVDDIEIETPGMNSASYTVLLFEFKADLNQYLQQSNAPVSSLEEVIRFNEENRETVMPIFGQDILLAAQATGTLEDSEYLEALDKSKSLAKSAIDSALQAHDLDALIAPTNSPAWPTDHVNGDSYHVGSSSLAAISGYPNVTVPAGFVGGLPVGLSFMGAHGRDRDVIEIAHGFEQAARGRRAPGY